MPESQAAMHVQPIGRVESQLEARLEEPFSAPISIAHFRLLDSLPVVSFAAKDWRCQSVWVLHMLPGFQALHICLLQDKSHKEFSQ